MIAHEATENRTRMISTAWLIGVVPAINPITSPLPAKGVPSLCTCSARIGEPSVNNKASDASVARRWEGADTRAYHATEMLSNI